MNEFENITLKDFCKVIDLLHPCMDDCLYIYDLVNDFYYISPHALQRFLIKENAFHNVTETLRSFIYPDDFQMVADDIDIIISGQKDFHNLQYRWLASDGQPVWINCRGYVIKEDNTPTYMLGCINEIGATQKADNVSGLLGASSLKSYMNIISEIPSGSFLLRLGLDDFKEINEKLGMEYGDMILKKTAEYISRCLSPGQLLYRIVSDEFILIDCSGSPDSDGIALYKNIRHAIDEFVEENHYAAVFTISGGLLPYDSSVSNCTFEEAMKLSEFSLSEAKRHGKNNCYVFSQKDYDSFLKKRHLTQILTRSVNNGFEGFEAHFQPLFATDSETLYGAETLMRFHDEELGNVSPMEFIPVLEETGLIIPAGKWILHQAMSTCKKLQEHIPDFKISINVSYIQIIKSDIIDDIISAVSSYGLSPSCVIIELTESGLLSTDTNVTKLWSKLKANGILLALDDFGTGYSNFHYLYDLRPDIIKIDRTFTMSALANEYEYNLLSLMSNMGHNMNLKMCIEGIETDTELSRMKLISPDYCQGYFFGKPCSYNDFVEKFL